MALTLPHNITNGTRPDADEVMGNFTAVKSFVDTLDSVAARAGDMLLVGKEGSGSNAKRTGTGTSTVTITDSSATFTAPKASKLKIDFFSKLVVTANMRSEFQVGLKIILDGSPLSGVDSVFNHTMYDTYGPAPNETEQLTIPIAGTGLISLSAGSHTVALQATVSVALALGIGFSIEFAGGRWNGIVMPT